MTIAPIVGRLRKGLIMDLSVAGGRGVISFSYFFFLPYGRGGGRFQLSMSPGDQEVHEEGKRGETGVGTLRDYGMSGTRFS